MRKFQAVLLSHIVLIALFIGSVPSVLAQGAAKTEPSNTEENKIALRVARISYLEGAVTVLRYTDEDWADAEINMPLMAGDKVFAANGARVEIQLDDQTTVRLGSDTFASFPYLDDAVGRLEITKGKANVYAANVDYVRPPFEIATSNMLAVILEHATVRVDVAENGDTELFVRRGEINVQKEKNELQKIVRGEKLIAKRPDTASHTIVKWTQEDTFDQWSDVRDAVVAAVSNDKYITPRISGYNDLNLYGDWVETADYGRVWRPNVIATDWAPYRDGRWVWREPYGNIWVSAEPWGWVPYHYGRWVYVNDYNWVWVPRETVVVREVAYYHRPVWSPALVSFTYAKHGRYYNYSLASGYYDSPVVGWFPLGVHDYYHPWYDYNHIYVDHYDHYYYPRRSFHVSFGYYPHYRHHHYHSGYDYYDHHNHGGITIVNNETNIYQNQYVDGAVTVVPEEDFNSGNTTRGRRVTIERNAEPSIQTGAEALTQVSSRRAVTSRAAASGNTNSVAPVQGGVRNDVSAPRTESRRAVDSKDTRTEPPRATTSESPLKDQQRPTTVRESSASRGSRDSGNVMPQAAPRDSSGVERPRSESRTGNVQTQSAPNNTSGVERPRTENRTGDSTARTQQPSRVTNDNTNENIGNTQPRVESSRQQNMKRPLSTSRPSNLVPNYQPSSRQQRNNAGSRGSSSTRNTRPVSQNSSVERYSNENAQLVPASSERPTSSSRYLQDTYPGRTVERPHAPVIEPRQSRSSSSSSTPRDTYANPSSSRNSREVTANTLNLYNQNPGTVNVSPTGNRYNSSQPRVYPPESRSNAGRSSSRDSFAEQQSRQQNESYSANLPYYSSQFPSQSEYVSPNRSSVQRDSRAAMNASSYSPPQSYTTPRNGYGSSESRSSSVSSSRSSNVGRSVSSPRSGATMPSRSFSSPSSVPRGGASVPSRSYSSPSSSESRSSVSMPSRSSGGSTSAPRSSGSSGSSSRGSTSSPRRQ